MDPPSPYNFKSLDFVMTNAVRNNYELIRQSHALQRCIIKWMTYFLNISAHKSNHIQPNFQRFRQFG